MAWGNFIVLLIPIVVISYPHILKNVREKCSHKFEFSTNNFFLDYFLVPHYPTLFSSSSINGKIRISFLHSCLSVHLNACCQVLIQIYFSKWLKKLDLLKSSVQQEKKESREWHQSIATNLEQQCQAFFFHEIEPPSCSMCKSFLPSTAINGRFDNSNR